MLPYRQVMFFRAGEGIVSSLEKATLLKDSTLAYRTAHSQTASRHLQNFPGHESKKMTAGGVLFRKEGLGGIQPRCY